MTTEILDTDEAPLAVHSWGGDGVPVLLAHPTGFHGVTWAPVARRLVERGYRVWSFDFRGHGDSARSPNGYDWQGYARDVGAVTRHLGLDGDTRLMAGGHSKGAAALLLDEADHPGRYARLWCYEPIMFAASVPADFDNPLSRSARRRRGHWPSKEEAERNYASKPPLDVLDPEALHAYVEHGLRPSSRGGFELKCLPEDEADTYAMGVRNGLLDRLGQIRAPVLVACGEHTDAITPAFAARIVDALPSARLEVFAGLGHFGPMEDPDRIVESIRAFDDATAR
ncbi:MAG: alpha/beta hydrolase [Actinobacteria bacterium]|nr:alpha/beta hydrolase [Actinomycetota bacterium]